LPGNSTGCLPVWSLLGIVSGTLPLPWRGNEIIIMCTTDCVANDVEMLGIEANVLEAQAAVLRAKAAELRAHGRVGDAQRTHAGIVELARLNAAERRACVVVAEAEVREAETQQLLAERAEELRLLEPVDLIDSKQRGFTGFADGSAGLLNIISTIIGAGSAPTAPAPDSDLGAYFQRLVDGDRASGGLISAGRDAAEDLFGHWRGSADAADDAAARDDLWRRAHPHDAKL
jgi:hypothetical protein